jgi:hypothetical protein
VTVTIMLCFPFSKKSSCDDKLFSLFLRKRFRDFLRSIYRTKMSQNIPKNPKVYLCEICNIKTGNKKDYTKHLLTAKHKCRTFLNGIEQQNPNIKTKGFACERCHKTYKARNSLWYHEQKCTVVEHSAPAEHNTAAEHSAAAEHITSAEQNHAEQNAVDENTITAPGKNMIDMLINENKDFKNIILDLVKSNVELQKQMLTVCQNIQPNGNTTITNSHNNNKTFNLQFFLNEQCKDAMNISEFVNTFELQLSDLESVGKLGYVEGITKIMVNKLKDMDIYKRPMHCSDVKRETMYVKDEDTWEKEHISFPKLRKAIKQVSYKNMNLLSEWRDAYPESKRSESPHNDHYMLLIKQTMGGSGEIVENETKIIRKIAKEVVIDKI